MRGVWIPFGNKRINEMFKLNELKHGSKFKKLVENLYHEKIIDLLTVGRGSRKSQGRTLITLSTEDPLLSKLRSGSTSYPQ